MTFDLYWKIAMILFYVGCPILIATIVFRAGYEFRKHEELPTEDKHNPDVYEIDVNKKYILAFSDYLPEEARIRIKEQLRKWLEGNDAFCILHGVGTNNIRLIKVSDDMEERK